MSSIAKRLISTLSSISPESLATRKHQPSVMDSGDLTPSELRQACRLVATSLKGLGLSGCVFGRAACWFYGIRKPLQAIDILVLTNRFAWTREYIMNLLVLQDKAHRFLSTSVSPHAATDTQLCFKFPSGRTCKIMILLPSFLLSPNSLNVPPVPPKRLTTIRSIPVMPLVPLLLLKLQAQVYTDLDEEDIGDLMILLEKYNLVSQVRKAKRWLPYWFVQGGRENVERYCAGHGLTEYASWFDFEAWLLDSDEEMDDES